MMLDFQGRARRLGHDVNTDYIISSSRKKETLDTTVLRRFLLEAVDPGFAASVLPGDVIVAGRNFGCGSAMEIAVTVIQAAGIRAVFAESFARSFYRNAINNGLLPVECDTQAIREADRLAVRMDRDGIAVHNLTRGEILPAHALPRVALDILQAGGLVPFLATSRPL